MNFKVIIAVISLLIFAKVQATETSNRFEEISISKPEIINTDSFLHAVLSDTISSIKIDKPQLKDNNVVKMEDGKFNTFKPDSTVNLRNSVRSVEYIHYTLPTNIETIKVDSLILLANPLLIDLVFQELPYKFTWNPKLDFGALFFGSKASTLNNATLNPIEIQSAEQIIDDLRQATRNIITGHAAYLYVTTFDKLPDPEVNKNYYIKEKPFNKIQFVNDEVAVTSRRRRLFVRQEKQGPWQYKANALAQFSESVISSNWYQGGNSNIAILGILSGQLNYDDKKNIQWDNNAEWRMGFNSVAGDTLRMLSTNDDVIKINSKLGVKAGGNFFYSGSVDFSTQFFNSYNGINSTVLKTSFLTPIRLNIGIGMDYKYKKIFSLMLSPVSYKYIYVKDNVHVNPNLFGIKAGETELSEFGSSFKAVFSCSVTHEIQLDSKLSFYTNYQKVEVDWETVCNLTINRFLSTRISFNPRYDNTVIGSKANVQFKQLLSVGFSHKFL